MGLNESWATDFDDAISSGTVKEVGILAGAAFATSALLAGSAGYRNAKNPNDGMYQVGGKVGIDAVVGGVGLLGAIFGGDYLGETGSLIALGAGIAGGCSAVSHYAAMAGAKMATKSSTAGSGRDPRELAEGGVGNMNAEARKAYESYLGR